MEGHSGVLFGLLVKKTSQKKTNFIIFCCIILHVPFVVRYNLKNQNTSKRKITSFIQSLDILWYNVKESLGIQAWAVAQMVEWWPWNTGVRGSNLGSEKSFFYEVITKNVSEEMLLLWQLCFNWRENEKSTGSHSNKIWSIEHI